MSYIGADPSRQVTTPAVDYFNGNGVTTTFQLTRAVTSVFAIQVVVNNVPQNAREAYGITSSNQLVFTSAPSAGTNNIYVIYDSQVGQTVTPSPGTVTASALAPNAVTSSALAAGSVTTNAIAPGAVNALDLDVARLDGTGAMSIPQGTTAQRPASPQRGMVRYNTTTNLYEFYDGIDWITLGWRPMQALGGVITSDGTFNYHTFTSGSNTFTVTDVGTAASFDFIAWGAGGGGGGSGNSRQGGAGAAVFTTVTNVLSGGYTVSIGGGGGAATGGCITGGGGGGGSGPNGAAGGRGGNAGPSPCSSPGGGGGGGTLLLVGSTILAAAGGGGGGGGAEGGTPAGPGGGGGQNGFAGVGAGGTAGASGDTNGQTIDPGGDQSAGGGGGGGFRGGGAGQPPGSDGVGGGGGGGGSSFFAGVTGTIGNGNGTTVGDAGFNSLRAGAGDAGGQLASGTGGRAVIRYRIIR
jgi:hypothetical protein